MNSGEDNVFFKLDNLSGTKGYCLIISIVFSTVSLGSSLI